MAITQKYLDEILGKQDLLERAAQKNQPTILAQKPSNNALNAWSKGLEMLVSPLNIYSVNKNIPLVGGLTAADFVGANDVQSLAQDVSYGKPVVSGGSLQTSKFDPRLAALTDFIPMGGVATKGATLGAKELGKEALRQIETGTGIIGKGTIDPRQYITAWHGSPYNFEKFSLEKVGAGEGKQVKGHGSYLASAAQIAQQYAESNAGRAKALAGDIDTFPLSTQVDVYKLLNSKLPKSMKQARFDELSKKLSPEQSNFLKENLNSGYMYKVDLPDEKLPYMLNWDMPLSQQSPEVQKILNENNFNDLAKNITNKEPTGENLYHSLGNNIDAANTLKNAGIVGNSYLDIEAKRKGLNPTNYVIFDPSILNILEKNKLGN